MLNKKLFLIPLAFFITGCSISDINIFKNSNSDNCDPAYFQHYEAKKNEIVGIGVAPPNFYGFNAQKKSAISKAINEIAAQMGVTVNSTYISNKLTVNKSQAYSRAKSYSVQTVNGKKVNARVIKECKAKDGNYYVLMKAY